ncbi:MAG: hypothetical protein J6D44_10045 [Pseudomonas sp.]|nr:hypothetical protein [Pseudomonas sp.]
MKLVDILAKGLKSWPEGLECLSQLKGTGYIINGKGFDGRAFDALQIADETLVAGAIVTRAEWQAAVDALNADKCEHSYANKIGCPECGELNAPKVVEWDGVGRPPEGTVCGLWYKGCDQGECTVLFMGAEVGVFKSHAFDHEQHGDLVHYSFYKVEGSTEEKDAQERKKAIAEMTAIAGGQYSPRDSIVQRLFDAGYRKEPKPCGS